MPTVSVPFQDLAQRIQHQEAELAKLREELDSRRSRLAELTRRKEELQAELTKVEKAIEAVGQAGVPEPTAAAARTPVISGSAKAVTKPVGVSLPTYLVELVRQAKGPITAKELTVELVRKKYPTTSKNIESMVANRLYDLVKKGILSRAADSSGVILPQAKPAAKPAKTIAPVKTNAPAAQKNGKPKAAAAKAALSTTTTEPAKRRSLHEVLTLVLAKSSKPLTAQELADRVTASGYESKSKDLKNVIWVSIGKLATVERVPGEGYRLKKGKSSGPKRKG